MPSELHVSLLADAMDLVGRIDPNTAATHILSRPDSSLEQLATARHEVRVWLESDSQDAPLVERLGLADEALAIAERVRAER